MTCTQYGRELSIGTAIGRPVSSGIWYRNPSRRASRGRTGSWAAALDVVPSVKQERPIEGCQRLEEKPGSGSALGKGVWMWYLTAGALLAVTRVALFIWVNHRHASDIYTETDILMLRWLYPEAAVSIVWRSLVGSDGTNLVWCSLFT